MDSNTCKSRFLGDLIKYFLQLSKVCSPHMQSESFAGTFSPITNNLKLNCFLVTVTKTAMNHFTHSDYKQQI